MKILKKILLAILILVLLIWSFGCVKKKVKNTKTKALINLVGVQKYVDLPTIAKAPQSVVEQGRESALNTIKSYFKTVFLDLDLAQSNRYQGEVLNFFSDKDRAKKDFKILTLGDDAGKLDSISKNDLNVQIIALQYNVSKKPSLSTLQFHFEVEYEANKKPVKLTTIGWLALEKQGKDWKIFNYWTQQTLRSKKITDG